jgi:hypothetical protein
MDWRMKAMIVSGLVALIALGPASTVHAEGSSTTIFTCSIGKNTVSVTHADGRLTYRYGDDIREEMSIIGTPISGNVFQMSQRFAGMEYQLRFRNGEYSYIVYDSEGNSRVGAAATSGLVIMRGTKQISERSCARFTEFAVPLDSLGFPEDTDAYSAM